MYYLDKYKIAAPEIATICNIACVIDLSINFKFKNGNKNIIAQAKIVNQNIKFL